MIRWISRVAGFSMCTNKTQVSVQIHRNQIVLRKLNICTYNCRQWNTPYTTYSVGAATYPVHSFVGMTNFVIEDTIVRILLERILLQRLHWTDPRFITS